MLTMYLCGALITTVAAIGASIQFADPRASVGPMTRVSVAAAAGALWPVVAVGALSLAVMVPVLKRLRAASDTKADVFVWLEEQAPARLVAAA